MGQHGCILRSYLHKKEKNFNLTNDSMEGKRRFSTVGNVLLNHKNSYMGNVFIIYGVFSFLNA